MEKLENFEIIDDYLDGNLDKTDVEKFESKLESDPKLLEEFTIIKEIRESIVMQGDASLKEKIKNTHDALKRESFFDNDSNIKFMKINKLNKWIAGIAAIFVLTLAAIFLLRDSSNIEERLTADLKPNNEIALQTLDKLESLGFAETENSRKDSLIMAVQLFSNFKFKESKSILNDYLIRYPEDLTAKFYLGLSYLNLTEYGKASELLVPLTKVQDFEFRENALWNLAICYLAPRTDAGDATAKKIFEEIIKNKDSAYYKSAKAYLGAL